MRKTSWTWWLPLPHSSIDFHHFGQQWETDKYSWRHQWPLSDLKKCWMRNECWTDCSSDEIQTSWFIGNKSTLTYSSFQWVKHLMFNNNSSAFIHGWRHWRSISHRSKFFWKIVKITYQNNSLFHSLSYKTEHNRQEVLLIREYPSDLNLSLNTVSNGQRNS